MKKKQEGCSSPFPTLSPVIFETFWIFGLVQTSADSTVRILSGFTVRCLLVKIMFKFKIRTLENPPDSKFQILTDRHRTVNPDRIRTALFADVWFVPRTGPSQPIDFRNQSITNPIVWSYLETSQATSRPCNKDFVDLLLWPAKFKSLTVLDRPLPSLN